MLLQDRSVSVLQFQPFLHDSHQELALIDASFHRSSLAFFQVLLSLPCIRLDDLLAFEDAVSKTSSAKEQKQHLRSFLVLATGNQLKAITQQKTATVITNISGNRVNFFIIQP